VVDGFAIESDGVVQMTINGLIQASATAEMSFELDMTALPAAIIPSAMMFFNAKFNIVGFNQPGETQKARLIGVGFGGNLGGGAAQRVSFVFNIEYAGTLPPPFENVYFTLEGMYRL
jgi:hypothetical protein